MRPRKTHAHTTLVHSAPPPSPSCVDPPPPCLQIHRSGRPRPMSANSGERTPHTSSTRAANSAIPAGQVGFCAARPAPPRPAPPRPAPPRPARSRSGQGLRQLCAVRGGWHAAARPKLHPALSLRAAQVLRLGGSPPLAHAASSTGMPCVPPRLQELRKSSGGGSGAWGHETAGPQQGLQGPQLGSLPTNASSDSQVRGGAAHGAQGGGSVQQPTSLSQMRQLASPHVPMQLRPGRCGGGSCCQTHRCRHPPTIHSCACCPAAGRPAAGPAGRERRLWPGQHAVYAAVR
jgi:hypothetical protein